MGSTQECTGGGRATRESRGRLGSIIKVCTGWLQKGTCSQWEPGRLGWRGQICKSGGAGGGGISVEDRVSDVSKVCSGLPWEGT